MPPPTPSGRRKRARVVKDKTQASSARSSVEFHPQRDQIIEQILAGGTNRAIAATTNPPLSFMCISRYRSTVIRPQLAKALLGNAKAAAAACQVHDAKDISPNTKLQPRLSPKTIHKAQEIMRTPVLSVLRQRIEAMHNRVERVLDRAEAGSDLYPIAPLMGQAHRNMELLGRVTGELDASNHKGMGNLSIQIVCPSAPTPESVRISFDAPDAIEPNHEDTDSTEEIGLEQI